MSNDREQDGNASKAPASLPLLRTPPASVSRSSKDLLQYYLAQVRTYPLLTPEEEKDYATRYAEDGDPAAAEALVTSNLRLVIKIAFQYHRQWANVLDLIQEGNVGLIEALNRYDPYREIRFSSYAQYWIKAMILRFLLDNFTLVRLGASRAGRKLFYQLQKERDRLIEMGIKPTDRAIAENLGVKESEVRAVDQHMRAPALSLHGPVGDGDDGRSLGEIVPEKVPNDPEVNAAQRQLGSQMKRAFDAFAETLTAPRDRAIWERRLVSNDPESLAALGEDFGVSKERVRQLEARIKKRLRASIEAEFGDEISFEFVVPADDS